MQKFECAVPRVRRGSVIYDEVVLWGVHFSLEHACAHAHTHTHTHTRVRAHTRIPTNCIHANASLWSDPGGGGCDFISLGYSIVLR